MPDRSGQIHLFILELRVKSAQPKMPGLTHATVEREGWCTTFISVTVVKKKKKKSQQRPTWGEKVYFSLQFEVRVTAERSQLLTSQPTRTERSGRVKLGAQSGILIQGTPPPTFRLGPPISVKTLRTSPHRYAHRSSWSKLPLVETLPRGSRSCQVVIGTTITAGLCRRCQRAVKILSRTTGFHIY